MERAGPRWAWLRCLPPPNDEEFPMLRVLLCLALVLSIGASAALAQGGKKKGAPKPKQTIEEKFAAKDVDKDGKLSLAEFKGKAKKVEQLEKLEKAFKAADTNNDGSLSLDEFKACPKAKKAEGKPKQGGKKGGKKPEKT